VYRYLVLIWDTADANAACVARTFCNQISACSRWSCAVNQPGLFAAHAGVRAGLSETRTLPGHGAVFGTLFTANGAESFVAAPSPVLDESDTVKIVSSGGRHLITRFWGRYVAFFRNTSTQEIHVLRDPSGALPCFYTRHENVWIVFSDVEDCLQLPGLHFTINWNYIAAFVPYPALQSRQTALTEVMEVQAGECVSFRGGATAADFIWHPLEIAQRGPFPDFEEAVRALKRTVHSCTDAWARSYRAILHSLSGGLDSSIVLSCIRRAPANTPVTCLTYYASGRDQDEREYARLAANHVSAPLIEHPLESDKINLERVLAIKPSTRPWFYMHDLEHSDLEAQLAHAHDADAIFSGAGGDAVFFQSGANLTVTDFILRRGYRPEAFRVALDAARIMRASVWSVLKSAYLDSRRKSSWDPLKHLDHRQSLIEPNVVVAARGNAGLVHPWLTDTRDVPPGVVWQIALLCVPIPFYDSFGNDNAPERVFPLLSQPVVELCLRTPTWLTIRGGRDRAIAREAFRDELPARIIKRSTKGAINQHITSVLDKNLEFVRGMLLDGLLVRERLLNRTRLEAYLSREHSPRDFEYTEITQQHLCTEAWLRRWSAINVRRAAA
jgi:asparagine synthase (glutamine-hydrolysing)